MPVLPGCATVSEAMALVRARIQGAEVLSRRSLRRHRVAQIRRGAAARREVLPDRRDRRQERRGLSRLPERARGRRLVGRAEGCDRVRRLVPHHDSWRARPRRCAADVRPAPPPRLRLVRRRHRGARRHGRHRRLRPRRAGPLPRDPHRRSRPVRPDAAEGARRLPDRRVRHAAAAARDHRALGRLGVRDCRHPGRDLRRRDHAGRAVHHLSGRRRAARRGRRRGRGLRVRDRVDADRLHPRDRVGAAVLRSRLRAVARHLLAAAADPRRACGARDLAIFRAAKRRRRHEPHRRSAAVDDRRGARACGRGAQPIAVRRTRCALRRANSSRCCRASPSA